jgi:hypothetical protein
VLPPDTVLPLQLQPDSGLSCNRCTLRVANTKCFRLILYPFICNPTMIRVATDIHSELQILMLPPYVVLPLHLQLDSGSSCNRYMFRVANTKCFRLRLQLQSDSGDSGSSCNRCTLRVANNECFRLILYCHFNCNPIVVGVAIDICSEL